MKHADIKSRGRQWKCLQPQITVSDILSQGATPGSDVVCCNQSYARKFSSNYKQPVLYYILFVYFENLPDITQIKQDAQRKKNKLK